jgi:hypothetical protein
MKLGATLLTILVLLIAPLLSSVSHADEIIFGKVSDDELLSLFLIRSVKATDTRTLEDSATATILKWDRPPRFRLVSEDRALADHFAENIVRPLLRTFTATTNLTATVSLDDEGANILTIIGENPVAELEMFAPDLLKAMDGNQAELRKLQDVIKQKPVNCFFKPRIIDRTLVGAVIYVPKPNTALFASAKCFGAHAAKALGLLGTDDETDTVNNRTDPATSFTPSDQAALRILYDPRVPSRIKIGELAIIVSAINKELAPPE